MKFVLREIPIAPGGEIAVRVVRARRDMSLRIRAALENTRRNPRRLFKTREVNVKSPWVIEENIPLSGRIRMFSRLQLVFLVALIAIFGGGLMVDAAEMPGSKYQTYISNAQFVSKQTATDFVPDGNLDKPSWRNAGWVKVDHDAFKPVTFPQAATEIASLWTTKYVYFAFRCKYAILNVYDSKDTSKDFWKLWDRDVVEIFLNPAPEHMRHYYEFEVAPNNLWIDLEIDLDKKPFGNAQWGSGFEHATKVDEKDHIWTCELRIPVAALTGTKPLAANTAWRINFFRADGQGDDTQRRFLSWSLVHNDTHSFHAPWSFGLIRFVK